MKFMRIESELTNATGQPDQGGKYYQTASTFERILKDDSLTADQKADKIADLIRDGNQASV